MQTKRGRREGTRIFKKRKYGTTAMASLAMGRWETCPADIAIMDKNTTSERGQGQIHRRGAGGERAPKAPSKI